MNLLKKIAATALAAVVTLGAFAPMTASAAASDTATINMDAACSLSIWKYDFTNAQKDGVWDVNSFTSTGWRESYVEDTLGNAIRRGDGNNAADNALGNGQNSNGYALKGVEFTYLKVADIATYTENVSGTNMTQVLYGFDKTASQGLLSAIGLTDGASRYTNADTTSKLDGAHKYYYTSNTLIQALSTALAANSTTVKNALESYIKTGGTAIPLTDENGKTVARELPVGLYLLVETKVPEMVTSTTDPFFVSLPMTTVSGNANSTSPEGGHEWNYNVSVYPKNSTGIPTLEKTVREAKADTGKNGGTATITDGFAHTATASAGDTMEYQVISTLPTITSAATALTHYSFYDSLDQGLSYNKIAKDVKLEIFSDAACTKKVASWVQGDGKFDVTYSNDDRHMTVSVTGGLSEINGNTANENGALYAGYSNYTLRLTYTAKVNSNASFQHGDAGNHNDVVLTWKRSSSEYYDTLVDDAHVFSYELDLHKTFQGVEDATAADTDMYQHVKFVIRNETDGYWLTAARNDAEGVYYVTGHVANEADATIFNPVTSNGTYGKVIIKGVEDDAYILTEVETANGYTLLKDSIRIVISAAENASAPCNIYSRDTLGALQNDPHYSFNGGKNLKLANIPQKALAHVHLTATATVDSNAVSMTADNGSANAAVPLTIVNTKGFDLPQTGDNGTWIYGTVGITLMLASGTFLFFALRKKEQDA